MNSTPTIATITSDYEGFYALDAATGMVATVRIAGSTVVLSARRLSGVRHLAAAAGVTLPAGPAF